MCTEEPEGKFRTTGSDYRRKLEVKARLQTPKWLFGVSNAIEIYSSRAHASWNFSIQIYNIIPHKSSTFEIARKGNVIGIQPLFSSRQASPFGQTE
jgi:hypothetical protein